MVCYERRSVTQQVIVLVRDMVHKTVLLELTRREAWILAAVLRQVGGHPNTTLRKELDDIYDQLLLESDVDPKSKWLDKAVALMPGTGGLWVNTNDVP